MAQVIEFLLISRTIESSQHSSTRLLDDDLPGVRFAPFFEMIAYSSIGHAQTGGTP